MAEMVSANMAVESQRSAALDGPGGFPAMSWPDHDDWVTAGIIRTGWNRIIQGIGIQAIFTPKSDKFQHTINQSEPSGKQIQACCRITD